MAVESFLASLHFKMQKLFNRFVNDFSGLLEQTGYLGPAGAFEQNLPDLFFSQ